jgi:ribA/ribD-fused uncharacterized protein
MISNFEQEDYGFLSNFYECLIWYDGKPWATIEHAYQACKTRDPKEKDKIRSAHRPGEAKRLGKACTIRKDWDEVKQPIMKMLVSLKFLQNPDLRQKLLDTGDELLVEGNKWHDNEWGDCCCEKCRNIEGLNYLGAILMVVRERLKAMDL